MTGTNYADVIYSKYENDVSNLENIVKKYPVSSLSQFLLLYNYKKNNDPELENLARKTALYFNKPAWLQFQLIQADLETTQNDSIVNNVNGTGHFAVALPAENQPASEENKEKIAEDSSSIVTETDDQEIKNYSIKNEEDNLLIKEDIPDLNEFSELSNNVEAVENVPLEELKILNSNEDSVIKNKSFVKEENLPLEDAETAKKLTETEEKEETLPVNIKDETVETTNEAEINEVANNQEENVAFEQKEKILEIDEINNNAPFKNESNEAFAFKPPEEITEEIAPKSTNETLISNEEIKDEVAFEPLYTVDYFASQGIKMREELLMNDKLGKQMKSFTDWLKSMKKLHPGKLPEQNEVIEKIIQSSAEESNADAEVLTEAMAEVLIKQDKQEKAIEMYQKLSLMNPSKSAYFAAKIESIKTN